MYAKLKKQYNLKYIFQSWTVYPPLIAAIFYLFIEISVWNQWTWFYPYQYLIKTITLLTYIPLCIKYKLYENENNEIHNSYISIIIKAPMFKATFCLGLGSILNKIAISANNGMPVFPSNTYWTGYVKPDFVHDGIHILGNAYTKLIPLCDWIDVFYSVWSPGDILIRLYAFIILYYGIKKSQEILK